MNNRIAAIWKWPEAIKYISPLSVFDPPSLFAKTMAETIPIEPSKTLLLDIGCGSGIIGIYCLLEKRAKFVTFNDVQETAILETRANVAKHIHENTISESQVAGQRGSFTDIPLDVIAQHNLIAFNPPQLPTDFLDDDYKRRVENDPSMAWFRLGGPDGLKIVREFAAWYSELGNAKPDAIILLSSFLGKRQIENTFQSNRFDCKIIAETKVSLRPILAEAAGGFSQDELVNRQLQKIEENSVIKWKKQLLTIRLTSHQK